MIASKDVRLVFLYVLISTIFFLINHTLILLNGFKEKRIFHGPIVKVTVLVAFDTCVALTVAAKV